ncbi:hypothetical protein [Kitasatospora sp. NPDC089509]|uniref:hypothetical protein n=1 Tax=Kitasatospora sp. NPDC089509 TaxID=3364079 RepID=UPI00382593CD
MAYDKEVCQSNISKTHMPACADIPGYLPSHCQAIQDAFHDLCMNTNNSNLPVSAFTCTHNGTVEISTDPKVQERMDKENKDFETLCAEWSGKLLACYCCCACMAYGTKIALSLDRQERIETIAKGEHILTGTLAPDGKVTWAPSLVTFSDGAIGGNSPSIMHMSFGRPDERLGELICTTDQPILLAGSTLVQASQVHVRDQLMGADGQPVPVRSVGIGDYTGGLHHLGTGRSADPAGGHLLQAAGIVVGDYYLQLQPNLLADSWADDSAKRPHIWEEQYAQDNSAERQGVSFLFGTPGCGNETVLAEGKFTIFTGPADYTGPDVAALFTPAQADDIRAAGNQLSPGNTVPQFMVEKVFSHWRGFYPDIHFFLDWDQPEPNVYALRRHGKETVVVTGGLARTQSKDGEAMALEFPGMVLAVGHGIARLSGKAPRNTNGFSTTGWADYQAFQFLSRAFWWDKDILPNGLLAKAQFNSLFDLISEKNAQGNPEPGTDEPSIACRRKCISFTSPRFPECAGGPPPLPIALEDAAATANDYALTLAVNIAPKPETVSPAGNYTITPPIEITQAAVAPDSPYHIIVKTKTAFQPDVEYQATIHGLKSYLGGGVDAKHDTLRFTPKAEPVTT